MRAGVGGGRSRSGEVRWCRSSDRERAERADPEDLGGPGVDVLNFPECDIQVDEHVFARPLRCEAVRRARMRWRSQTTSTERMTLQRTLCRMRYSDRHGIVAFPSEAISRSVRPSGRKTPTRRQPLRSDAFNPPILKPPCELIRSRLRFSRSCS